VLARPVCGAERGEGAGLMAVESCLLTIGSFKCKIFDVADLRCRCW
jgi:hypothetical protein